MYELKPRKAWFHFLNSSRLSDVYRHQYTETPLVQLMACRLFGAKPFWANAGLLLIEPLGTSFSEMWIKIQKCPCKKKLKLLFANCRSFHYNDVIMSAMTSQITGVSIIVHLLVQAQIKENTKAPRHWPLCGEFTGDRWISRTNGQ